MPTHPAIELRDMLRVASKAAYLDGATDEQINTIVALARGSSDYNVGNIGRLTEAEAARIIDQMFAAGADPDFRKSHDELDAEREHAERAAKAAAARKVVKKQDKEAKAAREEAQAAKDRTTEGRRVAHVKFGEGTVIAEDEKSLTVMFDGQKKALRMGRGFCSEL
ncbi:hypothetical protein [Shinella sp.]|uniref:hypothetical protein n=1 Tax=Shinella sp. TaxID=1870904 RepID=UPI00258DB1BF|nr:hypothetical protein [Shinella sp.]MCW5711287.1 hypothetical protein [Shinella sp.]